MRAYSHKANERPRCRRRAASLTSFHSLRVGNAGGRLVWGFSCQGVSARRRTSFISSFVRSDERGDDRVALRAACSAAGPLPLLLALLAGGALGRGAGGTLARAARRR